MIPKMGPFRAASKPLYNLSDLARDHTVHGAAIAAGRKCVADTFDAVRVGDTDGDDLKSRHDAVRGVGQRPLQRDTVMAGID